MHSGKWLPRRGLLGAQERVRSESYPEYKPSVDMRASLGMGNDTIPHRFHMKEWSDT